MSLDRVFEELSRSELPWRRRWPAVELMHRLDEIAGYDVFMPLYDAYVLRPDFPDVSKTSEALGIDSRARPLTLLDTESARRLRGAIMGGD